jgi:uncharacterized short protein YbdD (DUF466 family)
MLGERNDGTRVRRNGFHALSFLRSVVPTFLRQVAGMPDYAAYRDHVRRCHPGGPVLSECEFYREFVRSRYEDGPTRCC